MSLLLNEDLCFYTWSVSGHLRLALCNELFQAMPFGEACRRIRSLGYTGLEIAPFTLSDDPATLPPAKRAELRGLIEDNGLRFVGLHWLLAAPPGLHVTTQNATVRQRSWEYVRQLIDLCADLAGSNTMENGAAANGIVVFGSPKQRSTVDGATPAQATALFSEELARVAPHAESRGVTLLIEALPADQSDVINSLAEAVAMVRQIASPAVQTMFDTHNAVDEKEEHASLIRQYRPYIHHVHVNETDGREPGMGHYHFSPLLAALTETNYSGWISLEAFDFSRDPEDIARRAKQTLEAAQPSVISQIL